MTFGRDGRVRDARNLLTGSDRATAEQGTDEDEREALDGPYRAPLVHAPAIPEGACEARKNFELVRPLQGRKETLMNKTRAALTGLCIALAAIPAAAGEPANVGADPPVLRQVQREEQLRARQEAQRRLERARRNCEANRGTDCDTAAGLREWLLLERSRAEAVLDRVLPPSSPSAR